MSFSDLLLILTVAVTSTVAYSIGVVGRRRSWRGLASAGLALARCFGLCAIFLTANAAVGVMAIWILQYLCGVNITPYALDSTVWPLVSLVQATIWVLWGHHSPQ